MVTGCRKLAETQDLYFITITCRGKEISYEYAEENYLEWTNRLLDACRLQSKRAGREWHYVQVTERQKRKHPHSHFITTYAPPDAKSYVKKKWRIHENGTRERISYTALRSDWFANQVQKSGLGEQYDITKVNDAEAASRYVAKYLFKPTIFSDDWPKRWKRIRYSQGFPKQEEQETNAIVLLRREDWVELSYRAIVVNCPDLDVYETVQTQMCGSDCIIRLRQK